MVVGDLQVAGWGRGLTIRSPAGQPLFYLVSSRMVAGDLVIIPGLERVLFEGRFACLSFAWIGHEIDFVLSWPVRPLPARALR